MTQSSTGLPNLFHFATSELSQDAALAYLLSWANPAYKDTHPSLNHAGQTFLHRLIQEAAAGTKDNTLDRLPKDWAIESLKVGTQRDHIDIYAEINDEIFLIIEDKTNTSEHSDQIANYIKTAKGYTNSVEKPWRHVLAVYVKTGNESKKSHPKNGNCGVFLRRDILDAISLIPGCGNTIAEEFHQHLSTWESDTDSYKTVSVGDWTVLEGDSSHRAMQGYYLDLEYRLHELHGNKCGAGWGYVANPSGGFLGFWWHWRPLASENCKLYLQIEGAKRLQIRVSDVIGPDGKPCKAEAKLLHRVKDLLLDTKKDPEFASMAIKKSGTYKGGRYAGVVDVTFDSKDTYLVSEDDGCIDMDKTMAHLQMAMKFVNVVCGQKGLSGKS